MLKDKTRNGFTFNPVADDDENSTAKTITTRNGSRMDDNFVLNRLGGLYDTKEQTHQAGSIYDQDGLSPTLDCSSNGGNRQPFIVDKKQLKIKENTKQGYKIAKDGDGVNLASRMKHQRGNVQKGSIQTLKAQMEIGVVVGEENGKKD